MLKITAHKGRAVIHADGEPQNVIADLICVINTVITALPSEFDQVVARKTIRKYLDEKEDPVGAILGRLELDGGI